MEMTTSGLIVPEADIRDQIGHPHGRRELVAYLTRFLVLESVSFLEEALVVF